MAYAHIVTRCTISGTSYGGAEEWSTGFFLGSSGADSADVTQAGVDAVAGFWETFFETASSSIPDEWATTEVKLARLATDGSTILDDVVHHVYPAPIIGAGVAAPYPPQISLVATLLSANPRGLASKGRMYLPGVAAGIDATGHMNSTSQGTIATNLQTFFNAVNGAIDLGGDSVILASFGRTAPAVGPGVSALVTSLRVGNVYDTQRRRRNALVEAYVSRTVTP